MRYFLIIVFLFLINYPTKARGDQVYFDNVVIVLDASGSMQDKMKGNNQARINKINAAKNAIKEVLGTIPQSTQVGLLVFGGKHKGWVHPLGPRDDEKLFQALDQVNADGGTPLGEYMKQGADKLLETRKKQYGYGSYRLLVVTDGEANNPALVDKYTPDIIARGITTDVIGVDMKKAHTLATKVHSYRSANDPESLTKAIHEVFAEVGKQSNGQSGEKAFEELEGFPSDLSMAVLSAWGSSGNHPIGQDVPSKGADAASPAKIANSKKNAQAPTTVTVSKPSKKSDPLKLISIIGFIFLFIVFTLMRKVGKSK